MLNIFLIRFEDMDLMTKSPDEYFESLCIFQHTLLNELSLNFLRSSSFFINTKLPIKQ